PRGQPDRDRAVSRRAADDQHPRGRLVADREGRHVDHSRRAHPEERDADHGEGAAARRHPHSRVAVQDRVDGHPEQRSRLRHHPARPGEDRMRIAPTPRRWRPALMAGLLLAISMAGVAQAGYGADPRALMAQGKAAYHAGDLGRAWATFQQAAAITPPSATPALWLGAVAVARGDRSAAEAWFREALGRHPS